MDAPQYVSVKNDSWVISELRNSYNYTQAIECLTLEGHSEHKDDVYGPFPLRGVVIDKKVSVSSKYQCIDAITTSVNSSLSSQYKEKFIRYTIITITDNILNV